MEGFGHVMTQVSSAATSGTHYCFLPLLLPLLGPLGLALLVVPAVLLPPQPLVLVLLITVIPARESKHAVIAVLARPLKSPVPLTPMNKKIAGSHQGLGPMSLRAASKETC